MITGSNPTVSNDVYLKSEFPTIRKMAKMRDDGSKIWQVMDVSHARQNELSRALNSSDKTERQLIYKEFAEITVFLMNDFREDCSRIPGEV